MKVKLFLFACIILFANCAFFKGRYCNEQGQPIQGSLPTTMIFYDYNTIFIYKDEDILMANPERIDYVGTKRIPINNEIAAGLSGDVKKSAEIMQIDLKDLANHYCAIGMLDTTDAWLKYQVHMMNLTIPQVAIGVNPIGVTPPVNPVGATPPVNPQGAVAPLQAGAVPTQGVVNPQVPVTPPIQGAVNPPQVQPVVANPPAITTPPPTIPPPVTQPIVNTPPPTNPPPMVAPVVAVATNPGQPGIPPAQTTAGQPNQPVTAPKLR
jgi:hypothetical protein